MLTLAGLIAVTLIVDSIAIANLKKMHFCSNKDGEISKQNNCTEADYDYFNNNLNKHN